MNVKAYASALVSMLLLGSILWATNERPNGPWQAPPDAKTMKNPVLLTSKGLMTASELYEEKCVLCHGEEGGGNGPVGQVLRSKPADFTDSKKMATMTDGELFWKISTGHGEMPSWQAGLTETERWQLVSYLRVLTTYGLYRYLGKPLPNR